MSTLQFFALESAQVGGFGFSMNDERAPSGKCTSSDHIPVARSLSFFEKSAARIRRNVPKAHHIADLERRYKALKEEIAGTLTHASADDLMIIDLKGRMLHLRDELEQLNQDAFGHARPHSMSFRFLFGR